MRLTDILSDWLNKIETENPPPGEITALYFGIMNTDKGYMVFLTGAEVYDKDDDDWAGEVDYQPPRPIKYQLLPGEFTKGLKWKGVLELVANELKALTGKPIFKGRVAGAGYDDRELIMLKDQ